MRALSGVAAVLLVVAAPAGATDPALNARVFDRVWERVDRLYWDPAFRGVDWVAARDRYRPAAVASLDPRGLYRTINAMLALLGDSHVYAEAPAVRDRDEARRAGEPHAGYGLGLDGEGLVFAVSPGSPAAQAGVEIGWRLLSVGGEPADGDWHPAESETATLVFRDEAGRERRLALTAALLDGEAERSAQRLSEGVLLLRLDGFSGGAGRWTGEEIEAADPRAVILDLRENGGGEAIEAARVAGRFFAEKRTLLRRIGRRRTIDVPILSAGARAFAGPVAVLVGPRSASAAEAIAALIDESGRGTSVGALTAGALTGAALIDLPDGGLLSVAEADVRTPAGVRIEGTGWRPRVEVASPSRAGGDPVLARAVEVVRRGR